MRRWLGRPAEHEPHLGQHSFASHIFQHNQLNPARPPEFQFQGPAKMADSDLYAGTRAAALQILDQCGLFSGSGAVSRDTVATLLESRVQLSGPTKPFIPSPFRISEFVAGAHAAMAALCILLEQKKGGRGAGDALEASIDVEHASFVLYAPFILKWFTPEFEDLVKEAPLVDPKVVNEGGCWWVGKLRVYTILARKLTSPQPTIPT